MGFTSPPSAIHSVLEEGARVVRTCSGISKYLPECKIVAVKPVSTEQSSSTPKTKAFTNNATGFLEGGYLFKVWGLLGQGLPGT